MTTANLLHMTGGVAKTYTCAIDGTASGIKGTLLLFVDQLYDKSKTGATIWPLMRALPGATDSVVYIVQATKGSSSLTYIGKTLNAFSGRYPAAGPTGGLKLVFDFFGNGADTLAIAVYNASHPSLVEGWCFGVAGEQKIDLANKQDPS